MGLLPCVQVGVGHLNTGTSGQKMRMSRQQILCSHTQNKMLAKKMPHQY
jgi:hypothetical protein